MIAAQADHVDVRAVPPAVWVVGKHAAVASDVLNDEYVPPAPGYHAARRGCRGEAPPVGGQVQLWNYAAEDVNASSASTERMRTTAWPTADYRLGDMIDVHASDGPVVAALLVAHDGCQAMRDCAVMMPVVPCLSLLRQTSDHDDGSGECRSELELHCSISVAVSGSGRLSHLLRTPIDV